MLSYKPYKPVRICDGKKYWFNKNGILESEKYDNKIETYSFTYINDIFNLDEIRNMSDCQNYYSLLIHCITELREGDCIDRLERLLKSAKGRCVPLPKGVNRFVTKIGIPNYERFPENKNKKTFDFIRVDVNILTNIIEPKKYIEKKL